MSSTSASIPTTASDMTVPLLGGRYHFLLRRLHSLSGVVFGGYLMVHLLVNATIVQREDIYQIQVRKIHELPLLHAIEWTFIFLPIIYHALYGLWIIVTGQPNVNHYSYGKNWLYLLQRISAVIVLLFLAFHVLSLKYGVFGLNLAFNPNDALTSIAQHMKYRPVIAWAVYPIGILASCFHMANGFWAAAITWGLTTSAASQRRWGIVCLAVFIITFGLGITAIFGAVSLHVPASIMHR